MPGAALRSACSRRTIQAFAFPLVSSCRRTFASTDAAAPRSKTPLARSGETPARNATRTPAQAAGRNLRKVVARSIRMLFLAFNTHSPQPETNPRQDDRRLVSSRQDADAAGSFAWTRE